MPKSPGKEITRRGFLNKVGQGLVIANVAGVFLKDAMAEQPLEVPDPPGKKLGWAVVGLGNLAMIVIRRLGLKGQQFPLVKCGGVFGHSPVLDTLLDSVLASGALRAKISRLEISPAVGAARMAARLSVSPSHAASHGA